MSSIKTILLLVVAAMSLLAGGCDPEFRQDGPRVMPHMISSHKTWTITSRNGEFNDLKGAIDGMGVTAATTVGDYTNASIVLDLGRPCTFNMVALLHSTNERAYAGLVTLETSTDGKTWKHRMTVPGTRKVTYFPLMTPIDFVRYVRITAVRPGNRGWQISEIYFQ